MRVLEWAAHIDQGQHPRLHLCGRTSLCASLCASDKAGSAPWMDYFGATFSGRPCVDHCEATLETDTGRCVGYLWAQERQEARENGQSPDHFNVVREALNLAVATCLEETCIED